MVRGNEKIGILVHVKGPAGDRQERGLRGQEEVGRHQERRQGRQALGNHRSVPPRHRYAAGHPRFDLVSGEPVLGDVKVFVKRRIRAGARVWDRARPAARSHPVGDDARLPCRS